MKEAPPKRGKRPQGSKQDVLRHLFEYVRRNYSTENKINTKWNEA